MNISPQRRSPLQVDAVKAARIATHPSKLIGSEGSSVVAGEQEPSEGLPGVVVVPDSGGLVRSPCASRTTRDAPVWAQNSSRIPI
jgi:hypothetical protein